MSKQNKNKAGLTLPEDIWNLIVRKLRYQRREQQRLLVGSTRQAYSKLDDEISTHIRAGKRGQALVSAPLTAYREVIAAVTTLTRDWPVIVWETIASLLEKEQAGPDHGSELNALVDKFAWPAGQKPFALEYIEPKRFREVVYRTIERYGLARDAMIAAFDRQLDLAAAAARCEITNTARQAREGIGIRLDEYLLAQRGLPPTSAETPEYHQASTARREVRKQNTQAMYKEWSKAYREQKRRHPDKSDVWHAQQISRRKIAQGRNAHTIRKHMKT